MAAPDSKTAAEPESVRPGDVLREHSATAALNDLRELDRRARMDMILYRGRFSADPEPLPAIALTATIPTRR